MNVSCKTEAAAPLLQSIPASSMTATAARSAKCWTASATPGACWSSSTCRAAGPLQRAAPLDRRHLAAHADGDAALAGARRAGSPHGSSDDAAGGRVRIDRARPSLASRSSALGGWAAENRERLRRRERHSTPRLIGSRNQCLSGLTDMPRPSIERATPGRKVRRVYIDVSRGFFRKACVENPVRLRKRKPEEGAFPSPGT